MTRTGNTAKARLGLAWVLLAAMLQAQPQPAGAAFDAVLPIPATYTGQNITINVKQAPVQILPGAPTTMWTFDGTFPGPTIRRPAGVTTNVTFTNELPAEAGAVTIHRHGGHNACEHDGQPMDGHACRAAPGVTGSHVIPRFSQRPYTYDLMENGQPERGAFEWYHDHSMDFTSRNVWMGLAGMFIVDDGYDRTLGLPVDAHDVPLMITDRAFDANNQLTPVLGANEPGFNSDGAFGDKILVNGALTPHFDVEDRKYRFRILNASNDRSYELALTGEKPMVQIATESGLLPFSVSRTRIPIGPAERVEVVIDFDGMTGSSVVLRNTRGFGSLRDIMEFRVVTDVLEDPSMVPSTLRPLPDTVDLQKNKPSRTRTWILGQAPAQQPAVWTINGREFDHERVDTAPFSPELNTTELWTFVNETMIDHLVHIHDVDWRLVARFGPESRQQTIGLDPLCPSALKTPAGETCALKETFRVGPNETIVVAATFTDHLGRFMFHCHLLAHEDKAMMAQFEVVEPGSGPAGHEH